MRPDTAPVGVQVKYESCNEVVGEIMANDTMQSVKHLLPDVLEHIHVLLYQVSPGNLNASYMEAYWGLLPTHNLRTVDVIVLLLPRTRDSTTSLTGRLRVHHGSTRWSGLFVRDSWTTRAAFGGMMAGWPGGGQLVFE